MKITRRLKDLPPGYSYGGMCPVCADPDPVMWPAGKNVWVTDGEKIAVPCCCMECAKRYIDTIQSCGHPKSAIVSDDDGTCYCGECEKEAR